MMRSLQLTLDPAATRSVEELAGMTGMNPGQVMQNALMSYYQMTYFSKRSLRVRNAVNEILAAIAEAQGKEKTARIVLP